jgi:tRNA U34 5-methylaminomethyl-2-thiouridine-forming methyltransferase MnmC
MQIIATSDGSNTLFHELLDETYHSVHGALGESLHVYINNGLMRVSPNLKTINILEIGFGTGLNALLSIDHQASDTIINYYSIEAFPLSEELLNNYYQGFSEKPKSLEALHKLVQTQGLQTINEHFHFKLIESKLEDLQLQEHSFPPFDLVYYDAFAPSKQPEMWSFEILKKVSDLMAEDALFVTYCSQGQFKRNLKELGFEIDCPPGPFGKREITVAKKIKAFV